MSDLSGGSAAAGVAAEATRRTPRAAAKAGVPGAWQARLLAMAHVCCLKFASSTFETCCTTCFTHCGCLYEVHGVILQVVRTRRLVVSLQAARQSAMARRTEPVTAAPIVSCTVRHHPREQSRRACRLALALEMQPARV